MAICEFDIYAANKEEGSNKIAGMEIARELAGLIDEVMKEAEQRECLQGRHLM